MTENEKEELKEIRIELQTINDKIKILEYEKEDVQLEIRNLREWKRGRGIGFIIFLVLFFISLGVGFSYSKFQFVSSVEKEQNWLGAVVFSVSTTIIVFWIVILFILAILSIYLGFKAMVEVGNSKMAREYAKNNFQKNYYNEMEKCELRENGITKALIELKKKKSDLQKREEQLAIKETPWNLL